MTAGAAPLVSDRHCPPGWPTRVQNGRPHPPDEAGMDARASDGWVRSKRFAVAGCGGEHPGAYGSERS
jgi:hypothetical protein